VRYNAACALALAGDADAALALLQQLAAAAAAPQQRQAGAGAGAPWLAASDLAADPDLAALRGSPGFEALLQALAAG